MADYTPLDLARYLNAGLELLGQDNLVRGAVTLRGLPFLVGPPDPAAPGNRFLALGGDFGTQTVQIAVGQPARTLIFAHRLLETALFDGGPVGAPVATYAMILADGRVIEQPVRDRFEVTVIPTGWGMLPFLADTDHPDGKPPRLAGDWGAVGYRLTEASQGSAHSYYLFVWRNPAPEVAVRAIEIRPAGPRFLLAAITLGQLDEEPIPRVAGRPVILETTDGAERRGLLELEVDRGTATFPYSLPRPSNAEFVADPLAGWGQEQNLLASPAHAEVAASDSATLTVKHGGEVLGQVNWGQVAATGEQAGERVRVRLVDTGRNWVHTRVVDDETGTPLPCRVHFRTPAGIPYQPHGHHNYACWNLGSWHNDIGGDVRLSQATYAYIDGTCQGWLPRGELVVDVARGYEYQPLRAVVTIQPGQRELELRLRKVADLAAERFFSGDTHCHFLSTQGAHTEAAGEGLNVVNLLQSQWGHLFTNTEEFTGEPSVQAGTRTIVYAAQENRQHLLGHLTLLGQKRPIMPWCSDGPSEAELGGNLETTLCRWADACHEQGGTVVLPHVPNPNGEPAAMIATGRIDAVEFLVHNPYFHLEYYRYLNGGYRLPIAGGTDKMSQDVPVGIYRTYCYLPPDQEFTYDNWCRALRGGNTFHSGGPLLRFTVNGQMPGATVNLTGNGGRVTVEATATSIFPIHTLQIVRQGKVVAEVSHEPGTHRLELREELPIDAHTWLAARVAGPGYTSVPHRDGWRRGIMAHTSPVYLAVGGEYDLFSADTAAYMLTLIDGSVQYIRTKARQHPHDATMVTHAHTHHDHTAWLEEPFHQAREAIHALMHRHGIPH